MKPVLGGPKSSWEAFLPEYVLLCAAIATGLLMHGAAPPYDVTWQFWIARQMLGGTQLYADIWEVNPPLWFWSAMPIEWLAQRTGISWPSVLFALSVGMGVISAWLTTYIVGMPRSGERLGLLLLVFIMTTALPIVHLGQREQFALVTSLPYAALIARRAVGRSVPIWMAIGVAVLAGHGFALKHYFIIVPLILEVWLSTSLRWRWRPWRPELIVLTALALAYVMAVLVFAPKFLSFMVPMAQTAYQAFEPALLFVIVKPYPLFWVVAGLFLLVTRDEPMVDTNPTMLSLSHAVLLTSAGFALSYLLQRRGWDYHSIPAMGAMAVSVGLRLIRLRRVLPVLTGAALLVCLLAYLYPARGATATRDPYLDRLPAGSAVFVASFDASAAWSLNRPDLIWTWRGYSMWMVPPLVQAELDRTDTVRSRAVARQVLIAASQDIRCHPPDLILIENMPVSDGRSGTISFGDFLFRDAELRRFVANHYVAPAATPRGVAYFRQGSVRPVSGLQCRRIV